MTRPFLSRHWHRVADLKPGLKPHAHFDVHVYRGALWYVLHDAASNRVHRVTAPAFAVIGAMDGATTLEALWRDVSERLGPHAITQDDVLTLLGQLHQQDLLATGIPPDMEEMVERRRRNENQKRARTFYNPLAVTIPLANPDRWLAAVVGMSGWIDRRGLLVLWACCVLPAVAAAVLHWRDLTGNLSDQVLSAHNLVLLAALFPVTKLVHELGHGLAAKAAGAAVDEVGVMLLVLFPTPYVDVSSAQALPDRRERMLIGAAGMMAKLWLAALALLVWFHVDDGMVRAGTSP